MSFWRTVPPKCFACKEYTQNHLRAAEALTVIALSEPGTPINDLMSQGGH
jgi:hypothetical protein